MEIKRLTPELKEDFFAFFDSAFCDHAKWSLSLLPFEHEFFLIMSRELKSRLER